MGRVHSGGVFVIQKCLNLRVGGLEIEIGVVNVDFIAHEGRGSSGGKTTGLTFLFAFTSILGDSFITGQLGGIVRRETVAFVQTMVLLSTPKASGVTLFS
jgi:hypothetical protein